MPNLKIILIACVVSLLAACGGGNSGSTSTPYVAPNLYGSVYIKFDGVSAMVANRSSLQAANEAALALCKTANSNQSQYCEFYFSFGPDECAALVRSTSPVVFWGQTDTSAAAAETSALTQCRTSGKKNCEFQISMCNGNGKPSSNSIVAFAKEGNLIDSWFSEEAK